MNCTVTLTFYVSKYLKKKCVSIFCIRGSTWRRDCKKTNNSTRPTHVLFLIYKLSSCIFYTHCHQCTYSLQRKNCIYFAVLLQQFRVAPVSSYTALMSLVLKQSVLAQWYSYGWLLSDQYILFHWCLLLEGQTCIKRRKSIIKKKEIMPTGIKKPFRYIYIYICRKWHWWNQRSFSNLACVTSI